MGVLRVIGGEQVFDGPMQMALDEILYRESAVPILRFYQWNGSQFTFGYFQKIDEVEEAHPEAVLTRRWTGGGVVAHGDDCTFSLILPNNHPLAGEKSLDVYLRVHEAICHALGRLGLNVRLASKDEVLEHSHCFQGKAACDVIVGEQKTAGGAIRRGRLGILLQESIYGGRALFSQDVRRHKDNREMLVEAIAAVLKSQPKKSVLTDEELLKGTKLAGEKYRSNDWLRKR